jgi:hypothetical protein
VPVFVASKRLAYVVQAGLYISVFGMIVFLLVPVGMHKHSNPGSFLVESGLGISGWSTGTAWVLSISNSMYAFGATDGGQLSALRSMGRIDLEQLSISARRCHNLDDECLKSLS